MRFLLLVAVVALTVTDVSGDRRSDKLKTKAVKLWKTIKKIAIFLTSRSIDDVDQNGDSVLTRSELQQHMDERDVDDLLSVVDKNGEGHVIRDVLKRYAEEAFTNSE